jgi:hypothetical protein
MTMPQLTLAAPGRAVWTSVPVPKLAGDADVSVGRGHHLDTAINAARSPAALRATSSAEVETRGRHLSAPR